MKGVHPKSLVIDEIDAAKLRIAPNVLVTGWARKHAKNIQPTEENAND